MTNPLHSQTQIHSNIKTIFTTAFFALLFFLCSADRSFTSHVHGFNLRWGQILLLICALPPLYQFKIELQNHQLRTNFFFHWLPFFVIYGIAAIFAASPFLTGLKWGWGIFNIGLAALVCLYAPKDKSIEKGFQWGIFLISAFIWLEAIAIYVFSPFTIINKLSPWGPGAVSFLSIPIGYTQISLQYMGFQSYRPNAFYYEPSYAGCALSFALFILFILDSKRSNFKSGWIPAIVVSSVILCSSRSGIISTVLFLIASPIILIFFKQTSVLPRSIFKAFVITVLLIGLFCAFPNGRKYMEFITGPLGADTTSRIAEYKLGTTSEGNRLLNLEESFMFWMHHPVLGNGVTPQSGGNGNGLSQFSMATWTEIGMESGTLGVLAFLFAIVSNISLAWKQSSDFCVKTVVLLACIIHFGVQLFLSQTFPRLDYWLLFFLAIRLLINEP